jgi:hypothetical protein
MLPDQTPAVKLPEAVGVMLTGNTAAGKGRTRPLLTVPMLFVFFVQFAEEWVSALPVRR